MNYWIQMLTIGVVFFVTVGSAWAQKESPPPGSEESSASFKCTTYGSGQTFFRHCISNHGNVTEITAPSGSGDHVYAEGYAICRNFGAGPNYADNFFGE